jgi:class 3 adenylate cyclase
VSISMQQGLSASLLPALLPIIYQVGINIGDTVVHGDDILGDGVSIAARLEGLAEGRVAFVSRPLATIRYVVRWMPNSWTWESSSFGTPRVVCARISAALGGGNGQPAAHRRR